jgi:hypothetical protein
MTKNFSITPQYQILEKFVQHFFNCYMKTNKNTGRHKFNWCLLTKNENTSHRFVEKPKGKSQICITNSK